MAQTGKVSINSDTLNRVSSKLSSSASSLESDVGSKLPGKFQGLATLGLYSNGLTKIKEQVDFIVDTAKNLASEVSSHLSESEQTEEELTNKFKSGGDGNYNPTRSGNDGTDRDSGDTTDGKEDDGKKINSEKLIEVLNKIDDSTVDKLIEFLNVKKDKLTLSDLIFNYDRSKALYKTILDAFGYDSSDLSSITDAEYKEVQKTLIETIFKSETVPTRLQYNSILTAKEYLVLVAKKNNISVSDLLVEDKHENLLKTSLKDLYDGAISDDYNVSDATVNGFRSFVDGIASDKNIQYNEVLENIDYLL